MDDDELRSVLEDAGLSPYQAAAYVALLDLGSATATDVANACEVPDPRIYDVLRYLDDMGYVETYQQDSLTVRAHDPETVLADLRNRSDQYLTAAEEIEDRWNRPAINEHEVSIVKRFETILSRSRELIAEAEDEIVISMTPALYDTLRDDLVDARDRDVHVKLCLYTDSGDSDLPPTDDLAASCTEARHRDLPASFLVVVDRRWTSFAPDRQEVNEYGILVDDRTHTHIFHWFFRSVLWETWETIYEMPKEEVPITYVDLVECLRAVVPLLEDGVSVHVTVEGNDTETRKRTSVSGRIVETQFSGEMLERGEVIPLSPLAGRNSFTVETDSEESYDVGGWGARLEDIEARRMTITAIDD